SMHTFLPSFIHSFFLIHSHSFSLIVCDVSLHIMSGDAQPLPKREARRTRSARNETALSSQRSTHFAGSRKMAISRDQRHIEGSQHDSRWYVHGVLMCLRFLVLGLYFVFSLFSLSLSLSLSLCI